MREGHRRLFTSDRRQTTLRLVVISPDAACWPLLREQITSCLPSGFLLMSADPRSPQVHWRQTTHTHTHTEVLTNTCRMVGSSRDGWKFFLMVVFWWLPSARLGLRWWSDLWTLKVCVVFVLLQKINMFNYNRCSFRIKKLNRIKFGKGQNTEFRTNQSEEMWEGAFVARGNGELANSAVNKRSITQLWLHSNMMENIQTDCLKQKLKNKLQNFWENVINSTKKAPKVQ